MTINSLGGNKMKRIFALLIALSLAIGMVGCMSEPQSDLVEPNDVATQPAGDGGSVENGGQEPATDASQDVVTASSSHTETISETVLVDQNGIKITAKSLDFDGFMGPELKLLIENSSGKSLTFQSSNASVNGYMVETIMSVDVADGKKANDSLTFSSTDLNLCGIETVADMEFSFHIFDAESWDTYLDTEPIKLETSAASGYTYTFDDSGTAVYEGNDVRIVLKGLSSDSWLGQELVVYIENNSGRGITVQTRDVSVNGFMMEPIFSRDVAPGKHAIDGITFMDSDFEDNGITDIETVELSFHIFDLETWDTIVDTEPVTVTF